MSKQDQECTLFPEGSWSPCCKLHDVAYKKGGTLADKKKADLDLFACVYQGGRPFVALVMLIGVRLGGKLPEFVRFGKNFKDSL